MLEFIDKDVFIRIYSDSKCLKEVHSKCFTRLYGRKGIDYPLTCQSICDIDIDQCQLNFDQYFRVDYQVTGNWLNVDDNYFSVKIYDDLNGCENNEGLVNEVKEFNDNTNCYELFDGSYFLMKNYYVRFYITCSDMFVTNSSLNVGYVISGMMFVVCVIILIVVFGCFCCVCKFQNKRKKGKVEDFSDKMSVNVLPKCCCSHQKKDKNKKYRSSTSKHIKGVCYSVLFLVSVEIRNVVMLVMAFSSVGSFYVNKYDTTMIYLLKMNDFVSFCSIFLVSFVIFVDSCIILVSVGSRIAYPFQFMLFLTVHKEWLIYRIYIGWLYLIFIIFGCVVFFYNSLPDVELFNNSYMIMYVGFNAFSTMTNTEVLWYIIGFLISQFFLLREIFNTFSYDGIGSVEHLRKLRMMNPLAFPNIEIPLTTLLFGSFDSVVSEIMTYVSLLSKREDYLQFENSSKFSHLKWNYIKKMNDEEFIFLKNFFTEIEDDENDPRNKNNTTELSYKDFILYAPPFTKKWLLQFFCCYCCLQKRKDNVLKRSDTEDNADHDDKQSLNIRENESLEKEDVSFAPISLQDLELSSKINSEKLSESQTTLEETAVQESQPFEKL